VADLARKSRSQIVITTHSPRLLDFFKPEEVYVVAKVGAEIRVRRLTDTAGFEIVRRILAGLCEDSRGVGMKLS